MELLYDETYGSSDGARRSRNIWYGAAGITAEGEYGTVIMLNDDVGNSLCGAIASDLAKSTGEPPTETNWFFYGDGVAPDDIGGNILPAIMVRERVGAFAVNISISDHDFATQLDAVLAFKSDLEDSLARIPRATAPGA